jgi:hypothetical protein
MQGRRQNTAQRIESLENELKAVHTELILLRKFFDVLAPTLPVAVNWPEPEAKPS